MSVKVTPDEFVDLVLGQGVQVLELVHSLELDHVETVGQDSVCSVSTAIQRVSRASRSGATLEKIAHRAFASTSARSRKRSHD